MGARGPKAKPKALREAMGEKCDWDEPEAVPLDRSTAAPEHLPPLAQAEWQRLLKESAKGVLTRADYGSLEAYCRTYSDWRTACEQMDATGGQVTIIGAEPKRNPWHLVVTRLFDQLTKLASELALLPASRARLKIEHSADPEADELERLLNPFNIIKAPPKERKLLTQLKEERERRTAAEGARINRQMKEEVRRRRIARGETA